MNEIRSTTPHKPVRHQAPANHAKPASQAAPEPSESVTLSHGQAATVHRGHPKTAHATATAAANMIIGAGLGVAVVGHPPKKLVKLVEDVRGTLTDELRKREYQGNPNPMAGHCYVASEAIYHELGGKAEGWKPMHINHEGGTHWFLANSDGTIVDATADQFKTPVPYEQGKGTGFLTREPSKRAQVVIQRLEDPH